MKRTFSAAALAALVLLAPALQAAETLSTLLVVPARQRMIQIAFDMQSLRKAEVVCWRATTNPDAPELNYWTGKAWDPITLEQFRSHSRLGRKPDKVIFLGLDTPAVLTEAVQAPARFETFDAAMLVNNLDAFYDFSNGEWRLLAKRYGFMLRDENAKLRQQDRYSQPPPEEQKAKRPPVIFDKNPPPAEVIRSEAINTPAAVETPKVKPEPPKAQVLPPELPKAGAPKAETPKADTPKAEAPKAEAPTAELDKPAAAAVPATATNAPAAVESKPLEAPKP